MVSQRDAPGTLGEPIPVWSEDEGSMREGRRSASEELGEQDLARRRPEQVGSADRLGDAHRDVVDDYGELVGVDAVTTLQNEVAHLRGDVLRDRALESILEGNDLIRHTQSDRRRTLPFPRRESGVSAEARVPRPFVFRMGRTRDPRDLGARAVAVVEEALLREVIEGRVVPVEPLRLTVRTEAPALLRALIPVEPEPPQVVELTLRRAVDDAGRIEILHPQDQRAGRLARAQPSDECRGRTPEMQIARRRRSEASPVRVWWRHSTPVIEDRPVTVQGARRILWLALVVALPVPYWVFEGGWVPTIWLYELAGFTLAVLFTEGGSIVALITGLFVLQAVVATAALYVIARFATSVLDRSLPNDRRTAGVTAVIALVLVGALFRIYSTPLVAGGEHINLVRLLP